MCDLKKIFRMGQGKKYMSSMHLKSKWTMLFLWFIFLPARILILGKLRNEYSRNIVGLLFLIEAIKTLFSHAIV
jgi:hypothetical protein